MIMHIKESSYMEYGQDEDYEEDDPGNLLRSELNNIPVGPESYDRLRELLYTADERHILDNGIDFYDALTVYRLVVMANNMTKEEIKKFIM